ATSITSPATRKATGTGASGDTTVPLTDTNSRACTCRTFPVFIGVDLAVGCSELLSWEQEVNTKKIKTKRTADKNRIARVLSLDLHHFDFPEQLLAPPLTAESWPPAIIARLLS